MIGLCLATVGCRDRDGPRWATAWVSPVSRAQTRMSLVSEIRQLQHEGGDEDAVDDEWQAFERSFAGNKAFLRVSNGTGRNVR